MKKALLLGFLVLCACEENKYGSILEAGPDPKAAASVAAMASAVASTNPLPPPKKKKEWKCSSVPGVVDFAGDANLEKEVRFKLKKPDGPLTPGDLANVRSIDLTKYGPVDELNPCVMPKFTGLHDFFAKGDDLEDLTPISELSTLISLRVTSTSLKKLDALKKLVHMDRLDLSHTGVTDLTVVALMTDLTELSLDGSPVSDLKPLEKLTKLEKVSLANTAVKDVSPLKNCKNLSKLDISGTPATDYSMLTGKNLKVKLN